MTWADINWESLDRLREQFLSGRPPDGPYWRSDEDLANYDFTYGERIGWKWDAVLAELESRGWRPGADTVFDWGCGSGIAGRRVASWLGRERVRALRLWDHSGLAAEFARTAATREQPGLPVEVVTPGFLAGNQPIGVLVVSHVLNELPVEELAALRSLAARAAAILWVEPGTHEVAEALVEVREQLRSDFRVVAPCTHQAACGLRRPELAHHWCHHFADPPAGIHADANWVRFGQRAGIDLRSLPYSFLALERGAAPRPAATAAPLARVIGAPRMYKGFAKILSCDPQAVTELVLQKRDDPALFRSFKHPRGPLVYRWRRQDGKILGVEPLSQL